MSLAKHANEVRGKTIRLSWTDGPTKGTTQEHVFHTDGTVEWHSVNGEAGKSDDKSAKKPSGSPEKPKYASEKLSDEVSLVSYLSHSGYTLTVALNFDTGKTVGVASNDKNWMPVHGRFEVVH
ncbi:MAG TPA: hypothetical protein VGN99_04670 [Steroidobacteraceae bacterium]|jgi:hypothetical protein|nr:hypothetical protein [Steroidobacteraceae bacterium]